MIYSVQERIADICIPTCNRPRELKRLLDSIATANTTPELNEVIVIDNAPRPDVENIVERCADSYPSLRVRYVKEPLRGIVNARNRALLESKAAFIAFVDDDELISADWLPSLLRVAQEEHADAVMGQVLLQFPEDCPKWVSDLHGQRQPADRSTVDWGSTSNVLIRRSAVVNQLFDMNFNTSGGEDTEFFQRMIVAGRKIVYSEGGLVLEPVDPARLNPRWYVIRNFRVGQTNAIVYRPSSRLACVIKNIEKLFIMTAFPLLAVVSLPFDRVNAFKFMLTSVRASGYLSRLINASISEYKIG